MQQIEAYRDMIAPVVDAFKYLTQVSTALCVFFVCYAVVDLKPLVTQISYTFSTNKNVTDGLFASVLLQSAK